MNLLGKILRSSQRGTPRPWYSHRYIGRLLLLAIIVFIYEYYSYNSARSFEDILESKTLHVAYIKAPDVAFESAYRPAGFQYDVIADFARIHELNIVLHKTNKDEAIVGLNNNQFDILIGHFESQLGQSRNPFTMQVQSTPLKALLTTKDFQRDAEPLKKFGYNVSSVNWRPYQETIPWHNSKAIIFEYKEPKTPKTRNIAIEDSVYYHSGFPAHLPAFAGFNLKPMTDDSPLIESVADNHFEYGITTFSNLRINQNYISRLRSVKTIDILIPLVWLLAKKSDPNFLSAINTFLSSPQTRKLVQKREQHWSKKYQYLDYLDILSINIGSKNSLLKLKPVFESAGKKENIEWTLLAALAYQESKWDLDAVSPTHVRGVMQLTKSTAASLGVEDRTDVNESIHAAAKYIKKLEKTIPIKARRSDRIWMAVAAYNLGIGRIMQAYRSLREYKDNDISWKAMAHQLTIRSEYFQNDQYSTGKRAVEYVERIREFQKILRYHAAQ